MAAADVTQPPPVPNVPENSSPIQRGKAGCGTALLVARKRDAPLDGARIVEYFSERFGPVVSWNLGAVNKHKMRLEFASRECLTKALAERVVRVGEVQIRVFVADFGPSAVKKLVEGQVDRLKNAGGLECQSFIIHNENRIQSFKGRRLLAGSLESCLQRLFNVRIRVELFGSSATGFGWNSSDLDVTLVRDTNVQSQLVVDWPTAISSNNGDSVPPVVDKSSKEQATKLLVDTDEENKIQLLQMIEALLLKCSFVANAVVVPSKHCPILWLRSASKLQCELSIENTYGLTKTAWLRHLVCVHETWLPRLFSSVRFWMNAHLLPRATQNKFNSYCLLLILITYLQQEGLIAPAQEWSRNKRFVESKISVPLPGIVSRLFRGFVKFMVDACTCFEHSVFRPRVGCFQRNLVDFLLERKHKFRYSYLNVEDPFEVEHNPGHTVTLKMLKFLEPVLRDSHEKLKNPSSPLPLSLTNETVCSLQQTIVKESTFRMDSFSIVPDPLIYLHIQRYVNSVEDLALDSEKIRHIFYECCVRCLFTLLGSVLLFEITNSEGNEEAARQVVNELIADPSKTESRLELLPLKVTCRSTARTWRNRKDPAYKHGLLLRKKYPFAEEAELSRRIATERSKHEKKSDDTLQFEMQTKFNNDGNVMSVTVSMENPNRVTFLSDFRRCYKYLIAKYLLACFEQFLPLPE